MSADFSGSWQQEERRVSDLSRGYSPPLLQQQSVNLWATRSSLKVKQHAVVSLDTRALCVGLFNASSQARGTLIYLSTALMISCSCWPLSPSPPEALIQGQLVPDSPTTHRQHDRPQISGSGQNKQIFRSSPSDGVLMIAAKSILL